MRKEQIVLLVSMIIAAFVVMVFVPRLIMAGDLEPPPEAADGSGSPVSTMYTLEEIYNKLDAVEKKIDQLFCIQDGGTWTAYYKDWDQDGYGDQVKAPAAQAAQGEKQGHDDDREHDQTLEGAAQCQDQ